MIIKKLQDVPFAAASGYEGVKKQVLIGPDDGSNEIVMRYFRLAPGGATPHHAHDWPHLVKVEVGTRACRRRGRQPDARAGGRLHLRARQRGPPFRERGLAVV